jgi:hypothetical protein
MPADHRHVKPLAITARARACGRMLLPIDRRALAARPPGALHSTLERAKLDREKAGSGKRW